MAIPPINRAEVKRIAIEIARSPDKKAKTIELLGAEGSDKRKELDPVFVKAVVRKAKKIIREESGQPTLHPVKDWRFVHMVRNIQSRIERPSEANIESADLALERELGQMHLEDFVDVRRSAQCLLQMYEYALPPEVKGVRDPEDPICSEGTKRYFYTKLKEKHDGISYLELDIDGIATKSSLAIFMLTENEEFMPDSLHLPDLELNNVINILSGLSYPQKRDLITAYFMNPGVSGSELFPLMKSLFAIANGLDKEVEIETVTNEDPSPKSEDEPKKELISKQLREEVNNITQYVGRLLYTQAISFPDEVDTASIDFNEDDDDFGGIGLIDDDSNPGRTPFAMAHYTKQYVLHRQEILIGGLEEHLFDISFEDKLKLLPILSGDEHRLRLATVISNDAEGEAEDAKAEAVFLNEVNGDLPDRIGYRASKGVEFYANLKGADAADKLVEFLDHEDHLVRYEAFKKLCDEDITGASGGNALVNKIEKDIRDGNPSWALAALCRHSSFQYSSEIGKEDKYRGFLIRVLMLKDIDIKDAFKKLDELEVPFTLNLGEPTPGETEPLSLFEAIDYIGIPELVDITLHAPQRNARENARKILEVLLEDDPHALDEFMKTNELADSLRKAADIAHATSDREFGRKDS